VDLVKACEGVVLYHVVTVILLRILWLRYIQILDVSV
jgi:hypothetical protein